ncbi:MAG: hypothetical protein H0U49_12110 [Parachlamydiaceae bacterium]|nr:hypothetical protein [Parachlamydiaceae bacterium]
MVRLCPKHFLIVFEALSLLFLSTEILMASHSKESIVWDSPIQLVYDFSEDVRSDYIVPENDDSNDVIAYADTAETHIIASHEADYSQAALKAAFIKTLVFSTRL